jgi:hypothetical protein
VLPLTPLPPQTDGERSFFAELVRWDTGNAVRGAVVAGIPFSDGPLSRRVSDAVLFVPEGIAVVRVAEVSRQSGVVTASPEGPWTIGPQGTGGSVLQISGGGSTPLDGLMRAGMEVAQRLRRAGLEPGRIARLTVLVGEVTGLLPQDGDLGEGDQVAILEPRSLLLGIARASRYTGADNPRLWTTADVRAALDALELQGRGPSVEELNGEGFPYSPYVLRRRELMAPAAMAVTSPPSAPPAPGPEFAPERPSPEAIAHAVAASAAAGQAAQAAEAQAAPAPTPRRDTVSIDGPPAPAEEETGGLAGLFSAAEPTPPPAARPRTLPMAAQPPPAAPSAPSFWERASDGGAAADPDDDKPGGRRWLWVLAALVLIAALVLGGWWVLRDTDTGAGAGAPDPGTSADGAEEPVGPALGDTQDVDGMRYTLEAMQIDDTCVGHAYGETEAFFEATNCTGLSRALWSAELPAGPVVVSVVRVRMPDTATARELRALTDRNGSGNVSDLLREGITYPGGPEQLQDAEYASAVSGPTVTIVESSWVAPAAAGTAAEVDRMAANGLTLAVPPLPGE